MKINIRKVIFWSPIFLIAISPLIMFLIWYSQKPIKINAVIIDKTVYNKGAQEHNAITWILKNEKYTNEEGEYYEKNKNYYGFFPVSSDSFKIKDFEQWETEQLDSLAENSDVLFFADAYGVYENEWSKKNKINERSRLIYGGTTRKDVELLEFAKQKNKKIIAEFNLIASPTRGAERRKVQKMFDFEWSGWVGRYYDILDTTINADLPFWLKNSYTKQHASWPFKGAGIVFVHSDGKVEILDALKHLEDEDMYILTAEEYQDKLNLPHKMKYNFWFDVLSSVGENNVVSKYQIYSNSTGDSLLRSWGLSNDFPALIKSKDSNFTYMCGDFADNDPGKYSALFKGAHLFKPMFIDKADKSARKYFFWEFYRPLVTSLLAEIKLDR